MADEYNIYRHNSPTAAGALVDTLPAGSELVDLVLPTHLFTADSEQWFSVRAVGAGGLEDDVPVAVRRVAFDAAGDLILPVPNAPIDIRLVRLAGGNVTARFGYHPGGQETPPAQFKVYIAQNTAAFDFDTPDATLEYTSSIIFNIALGSFDHGTHIHVIIRCVSAGGSEEQNLNEVTAVVDSQAPDAPIVMAVETINR